MQDSHFDSAFFQSIISSINEYLYNAQIEQGEIKYVYHSPRSLAVTGYSPEELAANQELLLSLIHEDDRHMVLSVLEYARKNTIATSIEHRIVHKNGSVRWVTNSCRIEFENDSEIEKIYGVVSDITERKRQLLDLMRFNFAVEQSPSAVVMTNSNGVIEYVNQRMCDEASKRKEKILGQNLREFLLPTMDDSEYDKVRNIVRSGESWAGEYSYAYFENSLRHYSIIVSPVRNEEGEITSYILTREDITEKKNAEKALRESEQLLRKRNSMYEFELSQAQRIQQALLPRETPECPFLKVNYYFQPMEKVGGDFFFFDEPDYDTFSIFVADVSGHGISAALYLTLLKHLAERSIIRLWNMPDKVIEDLNRQLVHGKYANFITAIYALFTKFDDCVSLHFASGAHTDVIVYHSRNREFKQYSTTGTIVGMFEEYTINSTNITLYPGDKVFLFTDGVVELAVENDTMLWYNGLIPLLEKHIEKCGQELMEALSHEIRSYNQGEEFEDDVLLMCLCVPEF